MTSTICWHCHEIAQMVRPDENTDETYSFTGLHLSFFPDQRFSSEDNCPDLAIYSCVNCGYPNIAEIEIPEGAEHLGNFDPEDYITRWLPIEPMGRDFPDAPEPIAELASEAHKCYEIGANRATEIVARVALDAIVKEQEGDSPEGDNLFQRIAALGASGKITKRTSDAANVIREFGNDGAHNVLEPVDREYAGIVLQILDAMIEDLYSHSNLLAEAKAYIQNRKKKQKEASRGANR